MVPGTHRTIVPERRDELAPGRHVRAPAAVFARRDRAAGERGERAAVLGPISNAVVLDHELRRPPQHIAQPVEGAIPRLAAQPATSPGVLRVEGAILPGGYGTVVTLGAFRAIKSTRASARSAPATSWSPRPSPASRCPTPIRARAR
jgi:hypothetical protein